MIFQSGTQNLTASIAGSQKRQAFADISNSSRLLSSRSNNINNKPSTVLPSKRPSTTSFSVFGNQVVNSDSTRSFQPTTSLQRSLVSYRHTGKIDNIDERDREDPLAVAEYAQDIYANFKEQERATAHVPPRYMSMQPQITETMRSTLVDWLVSVQVQFKLGPETLYLAVNIIDRYANIVEVPRCKLQLVGATALFIAAKYEEVYRALRVRDITSICDNLYTRQEIVKMETHILSVLGFKISAPTAQSFLIRYLKAGHADEKIAQLASYILEGTLLSYPLLEHLPSQLAAASVLIARNATGRHPWSPTLLKYTEYDEEKITPIANAILDNKASISLYFGAVNKKYSSRRFGRVAKTDLSRIW